MRGRNQHCISVREKTGYTLCTDGQPICRPSGERFLGKEQKAKFAAFDLFLKTARLGECWHSPSKFSMNPRLHTMHELVIRLSLCIVCSWLNSVGGRAIFQFFGLLSVIPLCLFDIFLALVSGKTSRSVY